MRKKVLLGVMLSMVLLTSCGKKTEDLSGTDQPAAGVENTAEDPGQKSEGNSQAAESNQEPAAEAGQGGTGGDEAVPAPEEGSEASIAGQPLYMVTCNENYALVSNASGHMWIVNREIQPVASLDIMVEECGDVYWSKENALYIHGEEHNMILNPAGEILYDYSGAEYKNICMEGAIVHQITTSSLAEGEKSYYVIEDFDGNVLLEMPELPTTFGDDRYSSEPYYIGDGIYIYESWEDGYQSWFYDVRTGAVTKLDTDMHDMYRSLSAEDKTGYICNFSDKNDVFPWSIGPYCFLCYRDGRCEELGEGEGVLSTVSTLDFSSEDSVYVQRVYHFGDDDHYIADYDGNILKVLEGGIDGIYYVDGYYFVKSETGYYYVMDSAFHYVVEPVPVKDVNYNIFGYSYTILSSKYIALKQKDNVMKIINPELEEVAEIQWHAAYDGCCLFAGRYMYPKNVGASKRYLDPIYDLETMQTLVATDDTIVPVETTSVGAVKSAQAPASGQAAGTPASDENAASTAAETTAAPDAAAGTAGVSDAVTGDAAGITAGSTDAAGIAEGAPAASDAATGTTDAASAAASGVNGLSDGESAAGFKAGKYSYYEGRDGFVNKGYHWNLYLAENGDMAEENEYMGFEKYGTWSVSGNILTTVLTSDSEGNVFSSPEVCSYTVSGAQVESMSSGFVYTFVE